MEIKSLVEPEGGLIDRRIFADTRLWREGLTGSEFEARIAKRIQAIPLGRLGQADEVSKTILFLLSRANSHITGQVIGFNGGELMS